MGVNLNRLYIGKIANLGCPNVADLQKVLGGKIAQDSVFGYRFTSLLSEIVVWYGLKSYTDSEKQIQKCRVNIQTVNNYHKQLKDLIFGTFKGVATKYLNNYLVYYNFVNFAKDRKPNKGVVLFDFIRNTACQSRMFEISKRPALPI